MREKWTRSPLVSTTAMTSFQRCLADSASTAVTFVYVLPKSLDEKVARLHIDALGVRLTELSEAQAAYIGVPKSGPYKHDNYRY